MPEGVEGGGYIVPPDIAEEVIKSEGHLTSRYILLPESNEQSIEVYKDDTIDYETSWRNITEWYIKFLEKGSGRAESHPRVILPKVSDFSKLLEEEEYI